MPLHMDVHKNVREVTTEKLADVLQKDLEVQAKHGVKYLKYSYNEGEGTASLCARLQAKKRLKRYTPRPMVALGTRSSR